MALKILVERRAPDSFYVTVNDGPSQSSHIVTVSQDYYNKLTTGKISAEELVRRSFEFRLEREPKESIHREFDLREIGHYFPDSSAKPRSAWVGSGRLLGSVGHRSHPALLFAHLSFNNGMASIFSSRRNPHSIPLGRGCTGVVRITSLGVMM